MTKISSISSISSSRVDLVLIVPYQEIATFGVRSLDSYLRQKGYNIVTVYFKKRSQDNTRPTDKEVSLLVNFIKEINPLSVGFSVISPFNNISRMLTKRIRDEVELPIIWGGVHPTICPENCIDIVDALCIGEGEEPLCAIIDSLRGRGRIDDNVPNCWIKNSNGVKKNAMTYICKDLDDLPYPDLSGNDVFFINDDRLKEEDPYITYILNRDKYDFRALRGCPYSCTYCGNKTIKDSYMASGNYMRKKSVDRVISELKYVLDLFPNIKILKSYDEVFISNDQFVKEFCEKYKKEINLPFRCDTSLQSLTDENVSLMADAGLKSVGCGIEAFSEDVRNNVYNRNMSNEKIIEKSRILDKYNIFIYYDFIFDNPLESAKDIERCFWDLIVFLPRSCCFNKYSLSHLPKTELTDRFLKEGRITENDIVGMSDKGLVQWKVSHSFKRDKKIYFWIIIYDLFSIQLKRNGQSFSIPLFVVKLIALTKNYFIAKLFLKFIGIAQALLEGKFWSKVKAKLFS